MGKEEMGFWIFALDDPRLYDFYMEREQQHGQEWWDQKRNRSGVLSYALFIERCTCPHSPETTGILHLRDKTILLIEPYLMPLYCRLGLQGYAIIVAEAFCGSDDIVAMLKFTFSYLNPEGIIDLGAINEAQSLCAELLYGEYCRPYDSQQHATLLNLSVNMMLLSTTINYETHIKLGHLLSYALQFMELIDSYAFREKNKAFYAGKIGITEKMLTQALWAVFHKTFREILVGRVVIEAMRMLVFEDKSVMQIAHDLDYDASGFVKMFVKWKGMTPKELRTRYRKMIANIENGY